MYVDPSEGDVNGGDEVYIIGTGFVGFHDLRVCFGDANAGLTQVGDDPNYRAHANVIAPPSEAAGYVDLSVFSSLGGDLLTDGFLYTD